MINEKHAYLVMAHNNFPQLQKLIDLLDDDRNDIYLHIDKKTASFDPEKIKTLRSGLYVVDRIRVTWGGHSQIKCELKLLKEAVTKHYKYYHLLSGVDLPLKSQKTIHEYFDNNYPNSFVSFDENANETGSFHDRIVYYHFFQDLIGRQKDFFSRFLRRVEALFLAIQKITGVRRKQYVQAYKGDNWFSISDELAEYIVSRETLIKKQFFFSSCADEIFVQSLAMASPLRDRIIKTSLRAIDWERGEPYVYREEDVDDLLSSESLFGRKFDSDIDESSIKKVYDALMQ